MKPRRDWFRSVMLPVIGLAAAVGAVFGGWLRYTCTSAADSMLDQFHLLLDGACAGILVVVPPTWAVMWVVWLVRSPNG
jgi:hypothetical protein